MNLYWSNLLAWCVQIAIVIAACASLPWLFRLRVSRARLWYWHIVLLICLALPLLQPWVKPAPSTSNVTVTTGQFRLATAPPPERIVIAWPMVALAVLTSGIGLRLLWLGLGLIRLRRYRAIALPLDLPDDEQPGDRFADMRLAIAPQAELLISGNVSSPVTFGLRNPVILLPPRFTGLSVDERASIVCHELLHIQRHDWAIAIAEELVRAILWFHPAIWWLLGQIQLTREQVVDQEVIGYTGDRNRYLDALLAIASLQLSADLAPAPLFLRKHHLRQRVESIVSGVTMTKRNLLLPLAAAFATLPVVIGIAAWQFPLHAAPQEAVDDSGVEVQLGSVKLLHRTGIAFPDEARTKHISGTVLVNLTLNDKGEVTDAAIVSGPQELRRPVIQSVLNWHFSMESGAAPNPQIVVHFDDARAPQTTRGGTLGGIIGRVRSGTPIENPDAPRTIDSINLSALPATLQDKVTQASILHVGDTMTGDGLKTAEASLHSIDEHLRVFVVPRGDNSVVIVALEPSQAPRISVRPTVVAPTTGSSVARAGDAGVSNPLVTYKVDPEYSEEARKAKLSGAVLVQLVVDVDGRAKNIKVVRGLGLGLDEKAVEAVQKWKFAPGTKSGRPVPVRATVEVMFRSWS